MTIPDPFNFYSPTLYFKGALTLFLSAFMIVSAVSFFRFRIKKKETEYRKIIKVLGVSSDAVDFSRRAVSEEYAPNDYFLPVGFATLVCCFGFFSLFFGADLVSSNPGKPNLLLTGLFSKSSDEIQELRWQSQLTISMAFTGAFIWSTQNIIRRLIIGDLTPSIYYSAGLRMIFASLLSLMLSFFLEVFPTAHYTRESLPVIAFLTGMFPERALIYMREKIHIFSDGQRNQSHSLPLEAIEGMNMFHKARLEEVGIDNAQNLAEANVIELLLKTPFNPCQLVDWIAQAKLYVYFKDDIEKLRRLGIRTIFDFGGLCGNNEQLEAVAGTAQISQLSLSMVCNRIGNDKGTMKLHEYYTLLSLVETRKEA